MIIKTLEDAIHEISRLRNLFRDVDRGLIDLRGGRVSNAGPSVAGSDYITRDELLSKIGDRIIGRRTGKSATADHDIGVFGLGINSQLVVRNDAAPHHIVPAHDGVATLVEIRSHTKDVAIGGNIVFKLWRLRKQPVLDLVDVVELCTVTHLQNNDRVQTYTGPFANQLASGDRIRIDIGSVGNPTRGGNMVIKFKYTWSA